MPPEVAALQRSLRGAPLDQRIREVSALWLGSDYLVGPLGEAGGQDPDPVLRYDAFDCLTYIEEVLATALAPDPVSVHEVRMGLRYRDGGPYTYENRRHFMLAEWIPGVVADGWMTDITPTLEGAVRVDRVVTPAAWAGWWGRAALPMDDARLPVGEQTFWYLPLDALLASVDALPDSAVIFFVRQPADHIPIAITHVGLLLQGEAPTLRHASKLGGMVRDHPLRWYVEHQRQYQKWPMVGGIILTTEDFGPRR